MKLTAFKSLTIMKLSIFLLLLLSLQVSARGYTQTITISERNAPLERIFKKIEKQSGYLFVYRDEWIQQAGKVTIDVKNVALEKVLAICFRDQPITYTIIEKTIVLRLKEENENKGSLASAPMPVDVKGKVTNEKGEPVAGATISVKGASKLTATNEQGEFTLREVDANAILVITSVSFETQEIRLNGRTEIAVQLKIEIGELGAVAVTVSTGYQVLPKERVTGSFTTVSKEQLDQRVAPDIISKLEGITNGLVFNKNPNSGSSTLRVRGESTIHANPNPLIVLDNFPYDGNINNLNPNDIESITVLKDAAAASIWGVQAGNGVIVIVTKKGRLNQPLRAEINTNISIFDKPALFKSPQISPSDYIDVERFLFTNGYYDAALTDPAMPAVSPVVEILNKQSSGEITPAEADAQINALRGNDLRNDLLKHVYRKAIHQQYSFNLSGGSDKVSYFFSAGYDNNLSGIRDNTNNRITLNTQNTFAPLKNLEFRLGLIYTESGVRNNGGPTNIHRSLPYTALVDAQGNHLAVAQHRAGFEDTISNHGFLNWKYYPLLDGKNYDNTSRTYDTRLMTGMKYTLLKGLSIDLNYQYTRSLVRGSDLQGRQSYEVRNNMNTFAILDADNNYTGSNFPDGGMLTLNTSDLVGHYGRGSVHYNNTWNDHSVAAIGGVEARELRTENNNSLLYGYNDENGSFIVPDLFEQYPQYPTGTTGTIGNSNGGISIGGTLNRFRTYFGNAAYTYKSRYTFSVSGRLDGSNYFGVKTNQKTVPLWSTGVKWDIGKENFYKIKQLPQLSLRVTYGYAGNLAQNVAAITTFKYQAIDPYTGLPYAGINNIPNPELRWEKTGQFNIGLDFAAANRVISGSIDYFRKKGEDLIGDAPIDPTTGITLIRGNFAGLQSHGMDLQLTSKNINRSIQWSTTLMFNYAAEKVTRYDLPIQPNSYLSAYAKIVPRVGKPLHSLFSYRWAGLDPSTGDPMGYLGDSVTKGYADFQNKVQLQDLLYAGRYNPPVFGALQNSFSWKGINLVVNITYKLGHYFRRSSINYNLLIDNWKFPGGQDYPLRWQKPGDELFTNVPSMVYPADPNRDAFYNESSILVEKADHIRLQFISLNYSLDKKQFKKLPLQSLQVYLYANNLGILWRANDRGIDPDYPYIGYPPPKTFSAGIRASF